MKSHVKNQIIYTIYTLLALLSSGEDGCRCRPLCHRSAAAAVKTSSCSCCLLVDAVVEIWSVAHCLPCFLGLSVDEDVDWFKLQFFVTPLHVGSITSSSIGYKPDRIVLNNLKFLHLGVAEGIQGYWRVYQGGSYGALVEFLLVFLAEVL